MRKIFVAVIVGLIICAGVKAEAADVYVGKSGTTGYECYVMTDTIDKYNEARMLILSATLKMVDSYGDNHYLDYKFFALDGGNYNVQFTNSDGFSGLVTPEDTPIEWAMYTFIRDY
ncbi:MAG: hypothetical protein II857_01705 [Selenomonadaceae bacterium]|nr:hypothetical protein [Selenomonadaceae bacterium]